MSAATEHLHEENKNSQETGGAPEYTCRQQAAAPCFHRNSIENSPYEPSSSNSGGCACVGPAPRSRGPRAAGPAATRGRSGCTRSRTRWCPRTCRGARRRGPSAPPAPSHSCCLPRTTSPPLPRQTETGRAAGS
jgi:hypothetical protein|uniref:Uncharacterized protein n=1 Tax=Zea mays TaxID=4577 RepID=A0A804U809_MAIZE